MLSIRIVCVGKLKEQFYTDAAKEYLKRLSGYCKLEVVEIPEHRLPDKPSDAQITQALEQERVAIEGKLSAGAVIVALCVEGDDVDSHGFAELLAEYGVRGVSRLCFIVGGSHGLHQVIKCNSDVKLSLSKMTFPHTLARVMLLEQLYRAFKIGEGGKYHK